MDFFSIDVVSHGKTNFDKAMMIAFNAWDNENEDREKAKYYTILPDNTLILYSFEPSSKKENLKELPYEMNVKKAISFVWGFLEDAEIIDDYPDIDGSVEPGWRVWDGNKNASYEEQEEWVYDGGLIVAIQPVWLEYHK
jgi:hypothetical protein